MWTWRVTSQLSKSIPKPSIWTYGSADSNHLTVKPSLVVTTSMHANTIEIDLHSITMGINPVVSQSEMTGINLSQTHPILWFISWGPHFTEEACVKPLKHLTIISLSSTQIHRESPHVPTFHHCQMPKKMSYNYFILGFVNTTASTYYEDIYFPHGWIPRL